ncbi:c-type cytochrome [Roseibium aggregatum]|uniref:C-type cytochrome n=1 Tax=Roseibium aggregatum TaxID=187304 RepID=A0A939J359_9HYPH|nr:c-type cytochrome [Roseibium aggregatum]MBN9670242.1 c-type cytochrome [Roseibium aggregatum]
MSSETEQDVPAKPASPRKGRLVKSLIFAGGGTLIIAALGALLYESGLIPGLQRGDQTVASGYFQPPSNDEMPDGAFGDSVRRGQAIFMNTATNASQHVGNGLSCANCHLGEGRQPYSAPMWAAWGRYPQYRAKNDQINTMEDRVMGCFTFSMNAQHSVSGEPPPHGDDIYRDLQSYFYWLASGAPNNTQMEGGGFGTVPKTELGYSPERGQEVFAANCAVCHAGDGQGQKDINGRYVFPPLWGPGSYNWGAGMARINTAAAFIQNNMPLSRPGTLTDQEAWDVAAYINSFERPKDARQGDMTVEETRRLFHDGDDIYYGQEVNGVLLGVGTPDPVRPVGAPE